MPVLIREMTMDEAKKMGAMALFGEKYGEIVRVVSAGQYSIELCGGCHVLNTSEIGQFRIVSESSIASGVRRIEAVTGRFAYEYSVSETQLLIEIAQKLKAKQTEIPMRLDQMQMQIREMAKIIEANRQRLAVETAKELNKQVRQRDITYVVARVDDFDVDGLKMIAEELKSRHQSILVLLGSVENGKVSFVSTVSADLVAKGWHSGKIVKEIAAITGGSGGGRAEIAQAGGKDSALLDHALEMAPTLLKL